MNIIKEIREDVFGMTQKEFGVILGMSQVTLSYYENREWRLRARLEEKLVVPKKYQKAIRDEAAKRCLSLPESFK